MGKDGKTTYAPEDQQMLTWLKALYAGERISLSDVALGGDKFQSGRAAAADSSSDKFQSGRAAAAESSSAALGATGPAHDFGLSAPAPAPAADVTAKPAGLTMIVSTSLTPQLAGAYAELS